MIVCVFCTVAISSLKINEQQAIGPVVFASAFIVGFGGVEGGRVTKLATLTDFQVMPDPRFCK
jgi:hypothetical protein